MRTLLVLGSVFIACAVSASVHAWYSFYFFLVTLLLTMHACYLSGKATAHIEGAIELEKVRDSLRVEYGKIKKEVTKIKSRSDGIGGAGD